MDEKTEWALSWFKKLRDYLGKFAKYPRVKTAVEYHIILSTLWNSLRPIPDNIRTTLNFASTSCEKLMDFDEGGEDEELQILVLTAFDALLLVYLNCSGLY
jgi:hypothetical protein